MFVLLPAKAVKFVLISITSASNIVNNLLNFFIGNTYFSVDVLIDYMKIISKVQYIVTNKMNRKIMNITF